jgi:hypothetical protein
MSEKISDPLTFMIGFLYNQTMDQMSYQLFCKIYNLINHPLYHQTKFELTKTIYHDQRLFLRYYKK